MLRALYCWVSRENGRKWHAGFPNGSKGKFTPDEWSDQTILFQLVHLHSDTLISQSGHCLGPSLMGAWRREYCGKFMEGLIGSIPHCLQRSLRALEAPSPHNCGKAVQPSLRVIGMRTRSRRESWFGFSPTLRERGKIQHCVPSYPSYHDSLFLCGGKP